MLTWGATAEEATCTYPGDELVHDRDGGATMAAALAAPPERVWPWLVQMGGGRAGWYSWDWLDNSGQPSADHIVPEWQSLEVGWQLKGPANRWTVAVVEPEPHPGAAVELRAAPGHSPDPRPGSLPRAHLDGIWASTCGRLPAAGPAGDPYPEPGGRPRLVTRPFGLLVGEPVHFIMQTRQFHNLRTRVGAQV